MFFFGQFGIKFMNFSSETFVFLGRPLIQQCALNVFGESKGISLTNMDMGQMKLYQVVVFLQYLVYTYINNFTLSNKIQHFGREKKRNRKKIHM